MRKVWLFILAAGVVIFLAAVVIVGYLSLRQPVEVTKPGDATVTPPVTPEGTIRPAKPPLKAKPTTLTRTKGGAILAEVQDLAAEGEADEALDKLESCIRLWHGNPSLAARSERKRARILGTQIGGQSTG